MCGRDSPPAAPVISGKTRVVALLGQPVGHSLSPAMHNAAFRALGLAAVYVALPCASADVAPLMGALVRAGGAGNVTVPHKAAAAAALSARSARVLELDACNTFWADGGALVGDNTDVAGMLAAIELLDVSAGPWLVAGTGGSARALAAAARERGAALAVHSRDPERAERFARWAEGLGVARADPRDAVLLVNATPLGLAPGDALPILPADTPPGAAALDLVYAREETRWVRSLRARGHRAVDGREMLVAQGAAAFRCWFPSVDPPVEIMRAAVHGALR